MSFLDCSCISHAQVQPADIEERYEDIGHQFPSCDGSEYTPQGPAGGDDVTGLSAEPAHYQLLSELGRGFNNLSQVNMARHIPTGQLVAVKQTNLDECTEEELLQLTNEVLLSRLFRHSNLLTSRLVFSSCCQLWVLTPLMAYGSARLRSEIGHLQFGYRGLRAGQRPGALPGHASDSVQMLLQKLRGSHCCLLDVAPFPLGELGGLKVSRSGVDSGIGESVATGSTTHSAAAPPADRPQSPGPKNHSATLHDLVQLCLQQRPERRPSATELSTHAFFKQVGLLPGRSAAVVRASTRLSPSGNGTRRRAKRRRSGSFYESVAFECLCCVPGEEAHQRLLPQPHVPGGAPQQPGGPSRIQPPHPFLPRSAVGRRRRGGSLGLLLTPLPPPLSHTQHYILKS
ncbi:STE20-related kinase adapter protein beta isoform X5 [Brachyistius frenatus]|uniref:STE20-related kinase adapter protein beta isoform X5 n=1 Tax=Brachyistius frenatus TaxID=100188 RepID=UPI0037E8B8E7